MSLVKVASLSQLPADSVTESPWATIHMPCAASADASPRSRNVPAPRRPTGAGRPARQSRSLPLARLGVGLPNRSQRLRSQPEGAHVRGASGRRRHLTRSAGKCLSYPKSKPWVRSIARIVGRRIVSAEFTCQRILRGNPDEMSAMLAGRRIRGIQRRGKFIVIDLDAGHCLVIHLGMTGKLLLGARPAVTRTRS